MTRIARLFMLCALALLTSPSLGNAEMLAKGASFPEWKLVDHTGKQRSSAELAGKPYLLWYYPRASTPGCTAEGRGFRDAYAEISSAGLTVFGVSFDKPAANAEFATAEEFPFPLLSDTDRTLAVAVGAASKPDQWYAKRISYLVGPDGKVLVTYDDVDPKVHAGQVLGDFRKPATGTADTQ
jgi:peroxiredoxin Q/BCP